MSSPEAQADTPRPSASNERPAKIVLVAVALCLVCSVLVSTATVVLGPVQERNATLGRQREILKVAGIYREGEPVAKQFAQVESHMVDLESGQYVEDGDPIAFDIRRAASDPASSVAIPPERDIAKIHRRPTLMPVFLVRGDDGIESIVLPVHGYGLWSTLYGYVALAGDTRTVRGITFYSHQETPGLGGEIDNPRWRAQWQGKTALDQKGNVVLSVSKPGAAALPADIDWSTGATKADFGPAPPESHIDAIAGATLTSRGVDHLVHYWLGAQGFGPYLERLRTHREETT